MAISRSQGEFGRDGRATIHVQRAHLHGRVALRVDGHDGPSTTGRRQGCLGYKRKQERLCGAWYAMSVLLHYLLLGGSGSLLLHGLKHEQSLLLRLMALQLNYLLLLDLTHQQLVLLLEVRLLAEVEGC